jgi:hypothetical protein
LIASFYQNKKIKANLSLAHQQRMYYSSAQDTCTQNIHGESNRWSIPENRPFCSIKKRLSQASTDWLHHQEKRGPKAINTFFPDRRRRQSSLNTRRSYSPWRYRLHLPQLWVVRSIPARAHMYTVVAFCNKVLWFCPGGITLVVSTPSAAKEIGAMDREFESHQCMKRVVGSLLWKGAFVSLSVQCAYVSYVWMSVILWLQEDRDRGCNSMC